MDAARERYAPSGVQEDVLGRAVSEAFSVPDTDPATIELWETDRKNEERAKRLGLGVSDLSKLDKYVDMATLPFTALFGAGRAGNAGATAAGFLGGVGKEDPWQTYGSLLTAPGALQLARKGAPTAAGVYGSGVSDPSQAQGATLPPGFFSPLLTAVQRIKQGKASGPEWSRALAPGKQVDIGGVRWPIRPDEVEHSGLYPLFQRDGAVGKEEILGALENRTLPEFKELGRPNKDLTRFRELQNKFGSFDNGEMEEYSNLASRFTGSDSEIVPTHYSYHNLPGRISGYEESLTKWQPKGPPRLVTDAELMDEVRRDPNLAQEMVELAGGNRSVLTDPRAVRAHFEMTGEDLRDLRDAFVPEKAHFASEPNLLSHSRATARQTTDGKKVRVVEELQSDWHAQGKEKGYRDETPRDQRVIRSSEGQWHIVDRDSNDIPGTSWRGYNTQEQAEAAAKGDPMRAPRAPYSDTYHELELRKQLLRAVEEGDDYLALTTGQQQVDRYKEGITSQVREIRFKIDDEGKYSLSLVHPNGQNVAHDISGENLDSLDDQQLRRLVGKEMADKIASSQKASGVLSGDNLRIGGTGMRLWYDEKGPAYLRKLATALGGEVEQVRVPSRNAEYRIVQVDPNNSRRFAVQLRSQSNRTWQTVDSNHPTRESAEEFVKAVESAPHETPALKLTPKLKAYIKQHGLPLFSAAGASLFGAGGDPMSLLKPPGTGS